VLTAPCPARPVLFATVEPLQPSTAPRAGRPPGPALGSVVALQEASERKAFFGRDRVSRRNISRLELRRHNASESEADLRLLFTPPRRPGNAVLVVDPRDQRSTPAFGPLDYDAVGVRSG